VSSLRPHSSPWLGDLRSAFCCSSVVVVLVLAGFRVAAAQRETKLRHDEAPSMGHFVKAADVELFVQEEGPSHGPPVVLVHGTGAWSEIWRSTMRALADSGYRAIALDMPPFGYSSRPANADYRDEAQARRHPRRARLAAHRARDPRRPLVRRTADDAGHVHRAGARRAAGARGRGARSRARVRSCADAGCGMRDADSLAAGGYVSAARAAHRARRAAAARCGRRVDALQSAADWLAAVEARVQS
jgi:pimeloyl-ACP methyl ester carboxylesterase